LKFYSPIKTMNKIQTYREVFKGRTDVVPKFWQTKDAQRLGYSPLCRNEWIEGLCHKPYRTCDNADYIPLSDELIQGHLTGRHILGVYPLLKEIIRVTLLVLTLTTITTIEILSLI